jgi:hypothetical protein
MSGIGKCQSGHPPPLRGSSVGPLCRPLVSHRHRPGHKQFEHHHGATTLWAFARWHTRCPVASLRPCELSPFASTSLIILVILSGSCLSNSSAETRQTVDRRSSALIIGVSSLTASLPKSPFRVDVAWECLHHTCVGLKCKSKPNRHAPEMRIAEIRYLPLAPARVSVDSPFGAMPSSSSLCGLAMGKECRCFRQNVPAKTFRQE